MENTELIDAIKERFQRGQRRAEIRDALMQEGWQEQDIDDAVGAIQREAIKQLPGFSHFFRWFDDPKTKSKFSTPQMTVVILVGCAVFLIALVTILYFAFDPFNTKANQRDKQREADLGTLRTAMGKYFQEHNTYPLALPNLSPDVLKSVPRDPSTGADYKYTVLDSGRNFELCITFETQTVPCTYAAPLQTDIPIVPTATPIPDFVPQTASPSSAETSL